MQNVDPTSSSVPARPRRPVIGVLQAGRALAALAVLVHHAARATNDLVAPLPPAALKAFENGNYGVDFFFVLSGFIILHAHADDPYGAPAARAYLRKRLTRIYVPYLPVSIALIVLYLALPGVSAANRDWSLLTSLTLVPTGSPPALAVAWTLVHEMMFYMLFLVSYAGRGFAWIVAGWVLAILSGLLWGLRPDYTTPSWLSVFAAINLEFVAGMLAALAVRNLSPRSAAPCLVLGLAGVAAFFALPNLGLARSELGIALAFVVAGGVWIERAGLIGVPAWLVFLGNASYAIYLVHVPVAAAAARLLGRLGLAGNWPSALAACCGLGLAAGLAYHALYEKPALALIGRRARRPVAA